MRERQRKSNSAFRPFAVTGARSNYVAIVVVVVFVVAAPVIAKWVKSGSLNGNVLRLVTIALTLVGAVVTAVISKSVSDRRRSRWAEENWRSSEATAMWVKKAHKVETPPPTRPGQKDVVVERGEGDEAVADAEEASEPGAEHDSDG